MEDISGYLSSDAAAFRVLIVDDEVLTGDLVCAACNQHYPITDGIPNLLPPDVRDAMAAAEGAPGGH